MWHSHYMYVLKKQHLGMWRTVAVFIAHQIAQVVLPISITLAGQLCQSGQQ